MVSLTALCGSRAVGSGTAGLFLGVFSGEPAQAASSRQVQSSGKARIERFSHR